MTRRLANQLKTKPGQPTSPPWGARGMLLPSAPRIPTWASAALVGEPLHHFGVTLLCHLVIKTMGLCPAVSDFSGTTVLGVSFGSPSLPSASDQHCPSHTLSSGGRKCLRLICNNCLTNGVLGAHSLGAPTCTGPHSVAILVSIAQCGTQIQAKPQQGYFKPP